MKKMKLFFLGICAAFASSAMAQVTLTADPTTDKAAGWTLSLQTPQEIAGWQMQIALPEGVTIPSSELKVGDATFTQYDVTLPARYGEKYKAVGTPTENGIFLFFIPVAESYTESDFQITGTEGEACKINLKASPSFRGPVNCVVTNLCAADKDGVSIQGTDAELSLNNPRGDVNSDIKVSIGDVEKVVQLILANEYDENGDLNNDNKHSVGDIEAIIQEILK
jgi:uncharacterized protein YcnI